MNYLYHTQLCAPIADVHELTNLLRQMDFKVVSLLNLNWQEMHSAATEFLLLLDKGVYGWSDIYLHNVFSICVPNCDTGYTLLYPYLLLHKALWNKIKYKINYIYIYMIFVLYFWQFIQ